MTAPASTAGTVVVDPARHAQRTLAVAGMAVLITFLDTTNPGVTATHHPGWHA